MWTFPILLDCHPGFLPRARGTSLLQAPLGEGTVLSHLRPRLRAITGAPPVIVTQFEADAEYERAIRSACPDVEGVYTLPAFTEHVSTYEPSDRLLLVDPVCFPLDSRDPVLARLAETDDPRCVKHLVALESGGEGTKEYIDADASGRIRSIQRYYDAVTWPFAGGVACSLVPVACLRMSLELPLASLPRLRRVLASEGIPSRDFPLEGGAANLGLERGLLALNERMVLEMARRASGRDGLVSSRYTAPRVRVNESARLFGPVVLHEGAEIGERVTIIGPTIVGKGARLHEGATIAQCVIGPGQVVGPGTTLRHRVFTGDTLVSEPDPQPSLTEISDVATADWEVTPRPSSTVGPPALYQALKRLLDVVAAGAGLLLLAPLGLVISALIKLESRGPIHFGHVREGMGGRPFRCWKFRTMISGADQQQRKLAQMNQVDGPQFKVSHDPRRTRMGRFLSGTNLDEIPQLWNVLVGDMSLVGPRPSPFRENQVCVPWRQARLSVRPGVTGLWQICRHDRDKGDFHQWIYYDLLYVRHMSLGLDLKIIALTPYSFLKRGCIPLNWLLAPQKYGDRRAVRRSPDVGAASRPATDLPGVGLAVKIHSLGPTSLGRNDSAVDRSGINP